MKLIKYLWLALAIFVIINIYANESSLNDNAMALNLAMLYLSFPAGVVVSLVHAILYNFFSIVINTSMLSLTVEWLIYLMLGYFQWFKFFPWLIKKAKSYFFNDISNS